MRILREGDTGEGICPDCRGPVPIAYEYRTVRLERTRVDVPDVLVGVCQRCAGMVSLPAQSTPKLKEAREAKEETVEVRVPRHLDDIVYVIAGQFGVSASALRASLVRYYLGELTRHAATARRVGRLAESALAGGRRDARISLRVRRELWDTAWDAAQSVGIRTRSDMVRGSLLAAKEDVLDGRARNRRREIERLALAS